MLALSTSASAQLPPPREPQETPRFQSGVELIQLDVSVLDRNRKPVAGLTASDFTVLENGVARPIRAFAPIQLPARSSSPEPPRQPPLASDVATNDRGNQYGRLVVILMDRTIPPGEPTLTAKRAAAAAIESLGPFDLAAVATTGGGLPQTLTADRERLIGAVNRSDWSTGISREQEEIIGKDDPLSDGRCLCGLCVLETVTRISEAVRHAPRRRKVLLFIGTSVIFQAGERAPSADAGCGRRVADAQRVLFDSLALSNLTVHSVDPLGLANIAAHTRAGSPGGKPGVDGPVVRRQRLLADTADLLRDQGSLEVLPNLTGGRAVLNTNAPESQMPAILDESESYYLLAFEPGAGRAGNPRRSIEVKVARRGVTIVAQRQHVLPQGTGAASPGRDVPAQPSLDRVLGSLLPVAGRPLSSSIAAFASAGNRAIVSVTVDVAAFGIAGKPVPLDVGVLALDQAGRQVASARQTSTVELPPIASRSGPDVNVATRLELPPGDYEIRAGVSDPSAGVAASVFSQVTVPPFHSTALSLSDLNIEMGRASARRPASDPVQAATTRRIFHPGEDVRAFLQIYQGIERTDAVVPVTVRAQLLDSSGRVVRDQSGVLGEPAFPGRRADVALDLEGLPPGRYVLTVEVSTERHTATRTLRFAVQPAP